MILLGLFVVAVVAGAINAVSGGGTFIVFPALVAGGVAPVLADATASIGLLPGSLTSAIAYRRLLPPSTRATRALVLASIAGALAGALVLLRLPARVFEQGVPWLMSAAAALFTFGPRIAGRLARRNREAVALTGARLVAAMAFQFLVGLYGGYFGAGMGILVLAGLSLAGWRDMHVMSALRNAASIVVNATAAATFLFERAFVPCPAVTVGAGAAIGGYAGAALAQRIDPASVRRVVVVLTWLMALCFFLHRSEHP